MLHNARIIAIAAMTFLITSLVGVGIPVARAAVLTNERSKLGELPGFKFDDFKLTDRMTLKVNVGTGNVVVDASDLAIQGSGLNLGIKRFWNSASQADGSFGDGWTMGTAADVYLDPASDGSVTFHGPSGFEAHFEAPTTSGRMAAPDSFSHADLERMRDGIYVLTYHGSDERLTFDRRGVLTSDADRNGNAITFNHDGTSGRVTAITDTQGRTLTLSYEVCKPGNGYGDKNHCHAGPGVRGRTTGRISRIGDVTGRQWSFKYNALGQLVQSVNAAGVATTYGYDSGNLVRLTDGLGHATAITYDSHHRAISISRAANSRDPSLTRYVYGVGSTKMVDPNGFTTTYTIDGEGRATKTTDPLGNAVETTFDAKWNPMEIQDGLSAVTKLSWANGNLQNIQAPGSTGADGPTTSFDYADSAHPHTATSQTDPQKNTTSYLLDGPGNLSGVIAPQAQNTATNTYETDGTVCGARKGQVCRTTDFRGNTVGYRFDHRGNLVTITPPAPLGATTIVPDALSRTVKVTDGRGQDTETRYDTNDHIVERRYGGATKCDPTAGTCISYQWDAAGNLVKRIDVTGTTVWSYDPQNRPVVKVLPDRSVSTLDYDAAGNPVAFTDDGGTVRYSFDAANNLTSVAEPHGSCTAPQSLCITMTYDANHRRTALDFPNGIRVDVAYDAAGRETSVRAHRGSEAPFVSRDYSYTSPSGVDTMLRQSITDEAGNVTRGAYDGLSRLADVNIRNASGATIASYHLTFDGNGNRLTDPVGSHSYNAANQLTDSGYVFDGEGNQIAGGGHSFRYNRLGQTSDITTNGTTSAFTYADADSTERTAAAKTKFQNTLLGLTRSVSPGDNLSFTRDPKGNLLSLRTKNGTAYYVLDAIGSALALTDGSGSVAAHYQYDPFGTQVKGEGPLAAVNPFRFASGYFDVSTGLTKFGARYYDSMTGRWTQQDPVPGSIADPGTLNRYAYVGGNPLNGTDPSGRDWWNPFSWSSDTRKWVGIGLICAAEYATATAATLGSVGTAAPISYGIATTACTGSLLWGSA
ncbi:MAG: hypothetical protein QOK43_1987 [Acidimicrobiaceae bacterium]|nr:hypothetical protein [Acidimicrobiaceae bacterium]